jgi:hypothetical protein
VNIAKLRMSQMFRLASRLGLNIVGAEGMLHDYRGPADDVLDRDDPARAITGRALLAPAPSIYGGGDPMQQWSSVVADAQRPSV